MTVQDLIKASLRLINCFGNGESLTSEAATDAKEALNLMVSQWSNEELMMYELQRSTHTLNPAVTYAIGTNATINTTRPIKIESMVFSSGGIDTTLTEISLNEYNELSNKGAQSDRPMFYCYKPSYPLGTVYLWPLPADSFSLMINQWSRFTSFESLTESIALPPGYEAALKYNLAIELAPEYGKTPSDIVFSKAVEYKANLKRNNQQLETMMTEPMFMRMSGFGTYDALSDEIL